MTLPFIQYLDPALTTDRVAQTSIFTSIYSLLSDAVSVFTTVSPSETTTGKTGNFNPTALTQLR